MRELYFGILVWILSAPIAAFLWLSGDDYIKVEPSGWNVAAVAALFLVYLGGYLVSHKQRAQVREQNTRITGLVAAAGAATALSWFYFFFGMMGCMIMMLMVQLSGLMSQKFALLIAVTVPIVFVAVDYLAIGQFAFTEIAVWVIVYVLAINTSYRVIAERRAVEKSEQLVRELEATQILLSATTKRDERLRIARNLHDILGHHLTALKLQLEVASHVDGEKKDAHLENAKKISSALLSSVRTTVSEFRGDTDVKLGEALRALTQHIPRLNVSLELTFDEALLTERQVEVIFRCAQEALTNVMKHARADHCAVALRSDDHFLTLVVHDNGPNSTEVCPGNGLTGLRERVEAIDGELQIKADEQGFALTVRLPIGDHIP